jgi:hypothetical protein
MTLSPEAIISMIALLITCVPVYRLIMAHYQNMVQQGQNRIQNRGAPKVRRSILLINRLRCPKPSVQAMAKVF